MNPNNRHVAYVIVEGFEEDVLIDGIRQHNRAAEGDTVLVQIFSKKKEDSVGKGEESK